MDRTGDGFVAVFHSPKAAIQCGLAIATDVSELGIAVRVGLHTAEITLSRERVTGIGVHLAARICASGVPGQVLVSQAVRDVEFGSGIDFVDLGVFELKGFEGEWHLYQVGASV